MKNKKSLGQHWLYNREILDAIAGLAAGDLDADETFGSSGADGGVGGADFGVDSGEMSGLSDNRGSEQNPDTCLKNDPCQAKKPHPCKPDTCLEIGPGLGTLTAALFRRFFKIIAVEYDERLAHNLPGSFPGKDLTVVNQDFLQFNLEKMETPYIIAGNIPYYITQPIIEKVLKAKKRPERVVLLMQKEVAERVAAVDGKQSVLALTVQNYAKVQLGPVVKAQEFTPPPKVDSQALILTPHEPIYNEKILELVKKGFKSPRKKLIHNLPDAKGFLSKIGVSEDARPADLSLDDWAQLLMLDLC